MRVFFKCMPATTRGLLIRALFSHLAVQYQRTGGLFEMSKTLKLLRELREGLPEMTDGQMLTHAVNVTNHHFEGKK